MPSNPSSEWFSIGDVYYGINNCYEELHWKLETLHANYNLSISTNSTLIALTSKFVPHPNIIEVFSISGNKMYSVNYNNSTESHIVGVEFRNEALCVVFSNQKFRYYSDFKGNFNEYSFTNDLVVLSQIGANELASDGDNLPRSYISSVNGDEIEVVYRIKKVHVWDKYLGIELSDGLILTDLDNFKNYYVPVVNFDIQRVGCLELCSIDNGAISLIASYEKTVLTIKIDINSASFEIIDHGLTDGPFSEVSVSPNGQLVALLNSNVSIIFVINNDFDQVLLEYDASNDQSLPHQMKWCGNDAIVLSFRDELKLIGPDQQSFSYFYDIVEEDDIDIDMLLTSNNDLKFTIPILKTESDGLRIITDNKIQFLNRIDDKLIDLYRVGSSAPSSILLDCVDHIATNSSKANSSISLLRADGALQSAIIGCLEAALEEFNPNWQKKILNAVSFGKAYDDDYFDADKFVRTINILKVLNQLHASDIGIFVTYKQLQHIGWEEILDMLIRRDMFYLSLKIIDLLNLKQYKTKLYIEWCSSKIKKELNLSDLELFKIVTNKLSDINPPIGEVLEAAFEEGRNQLCKLLIILEPSILRRFKYYMEYESLEVALVKTLQSCDYDLCRLVLLHLQDSLSLSQFFKILNQNEQVQSLTDKTDLANYGLTFPEDKLIVNGDLIGNFWVQGIGIRNIKSLENYYKLEEKKYEMDIFKIKNSLFHVENYESYRHSLSKMALRTPDHTLSKFYNMERDFLDVKKKLGEIYNDDFMREKSISSIIIRLIKMHQLKQASKVVKEFKVSTEKYWYLVLQTYCSMGEFEKLYKYVVDFSGNTTNLKSPIGFQPFVEMCMKYNAPKDQISSYILSCTNITYSEKVKLFIKNEDLILASQEAFKNKDINILQNLSKRATELGENNTLNLIKGLISKLGY